MKKTVIYIGNFLFPHGNAASQLVLSNGKILRDLGYNVIFIGNKPGLNEKLLINTKTEFEGFTTYSIPFNKNPKELITLNRIDKQLLSFLDSASNELVSVICYGSPAFFTTVSKVRKWCKKNDVLFIANYADVSALTHGTIPERVFKWCNHTLLRANLKYGSDGLIAVSEYVRDYLSYGNKKTIVLPPLVDSKALPKPQISESDTVRIVYAGVPFPIDGRKVDESSYKDRLDLTIDLLGEAYKVNKNFVFDIYGLTKEQYLGVIKKHRELLDKLSDVIVFHGGTSHNEILNILSKADFSINLREINRMTTAGFSTKFVESISCGTPTITTNTSDLDKYLVEGKNGFFLDISDRKKAVEKLLTIISLDKSEIERIKEYCYNSKLFDYRNYMKQMNLFMEDIKKENYKFGK